jgi:predicted DNA-binding protein (MmcQ/YjbR family)
VHYRLAPARFLTTIMTTARSEDPRLKRLSAICLALPETARERRVSHAAFRVRSRVFAYYLHDHHGDGIVAVSCRTARGENRDWVSADPPRFYLPAYIGPRGWVGLRLDIAPVDWRQVAEFVVESYRLAAPKHLAAQVVGERRGGDRRTGAA